MQSSAVWFLASMLSLSGALVVAPVELHAQDTFEVQVYEYATVPRGRWNLETHFNYTLRGVKQAEGLVEPSHHQAHLTFELTRGITDYFELAGYLVLARRPGEGPEYAGYRIRPRVRFPESWNLPVKVSLSAEVGWPEAKYEEAKSTLEIRPVLEKEFGRWQMDLNPTVGKALSGTGDSSWDLEPGARLGYALNKTVDLSLEYYGSLGPVSDLLPSNEMVQLIFPGADIAWGDDRVFNIGVGANLTDNGTRAMLKMRFGWMFGGK